MAKSNSVAIALAFIGSTLVSGFAGVETMPPPPAEPTVPQPFYEPEYIPFGEVGEMENFSSINIIPSQYPPGSTYLPPEGDGLIQIPIVISPNQTVIV